MRALREFSRWERFVLVVLGVFVLSDYNTPFFALRVVRADSYSLWQFRVGPVALPDLFLLLVAAVWITLWLARKRGRIVRYPMDGYALAYGVITAYGAVVGLVSFTHNDVFREWLYDVRLPLDYLIVYVVLSRMLCSRERVRAFWRLGLSYSYVYVIVNFLVWAFFFFIIGLEPIMSFGRSIVFSDVSSVYPLAFFMTLGAVLALTRSGSRSVRVKTIALGLVSFGMLIYSARRGPVLAAIITVFVTVLLINRQRVWARVTVYGATTLALGVFALCLGASPDEYIDPLLSLANKDNPSTHVRYTMTQNVWYNIDKYNLLWFGQGLGRRYEMEYCDPELENVTAFQPDEIGRRWRKTLDVSNPTYMYWMKYGLVGGSAFVLLPLAMLYVAYLYARSLKQQRLKQALVVTCLTSLFVPLTVLYAGDPKDAVIASCVLALCSATIKFGGEWN